MTGLLAAALKFVQIVKPSSPAAGQNKLYFKSDGLLYSLSSAGVETLVTNSAGEPVIAAGTTAQYWRGDKTWQTLPTTSPPSGTASGDLSGNYPGPAVAALAITDAKVAAANKDGTTAVPSMRTLGTGSVQAAAGNHVHSGTYEPPITAGTTAQYYRGDKTFQTLRLDLIPVPTAAVSMNTQKITNLSTPTLGTDAAHKSYVDNAVVIASGVAVTPIPGALNTVVNVLVTFPAGLFTTTPVVTATANGSSAAALGTVTVANITTTGCNLYGYRSSGGLAAITIEWIAIQ